MTTDKVMFSSLSPAANTFVTTRFAMGASGYGWNDVEKPLSIMGYAGTWALHLGEAGYTVGRVDNADERLETTVVVVEADNSAAAADLVEELGFGTVEVGTVRDGVDAVVILGADAATPPS